MNYLKYKGYQAKIEYSAEDNILYGIIIGINDFVDFASENVADITTEFYKAVDDYIAFCKEVGKQPEKTCSGSFNVRISPDLHRQAMLIASQKGISLNQFISEATQTAVSNA